MEVTQQLRPKQTKRTPRPEDDDILSDREKPGSRLKYRLNKNIALDYGNDCSDYLSNNRIISEDFLDVLYQCTIKCYKCIFTLKFVDVAFGTAKSITGKCYNKNCDLDSQLKASSKQRGNFYS